MGWKCPHCHEELKEDDVIRGVCSHCHRVFDATQIVRIGVNQKNSTESHPSQNSVNLNKENFEKTNFRAQQTLLYKKSRNVLLKRINIREKDILIDAAGLSKYIAVTEGFVYIVTLGVHTGSFFGEKIKSFSIDSISAVDVSTGLICGKFELTIPGILGDTSTWDSGFIADGLNENVINFDKSEIELFEAIAQKIRELKKQKKSSPESSLSSQDIFAKIEKLAKLKKEGLITEEEFQKKKEELLKRL